MSSFAQFVHSKSFMVSEPAFTTEQNDAFKVQILNNNKILDSIMCPLHKAAIRTKHIIGEYESYENIQDFRPITEKERQKMVLLEKNLDFCVLKSRIDFPSQRDGNENNSTATSGSSCGSFGDIPETYTKQFRKQDTAIKKDAAKLKQPVIQFPTIDMRNEFSIHWTRGDKNCKDNSFTLKHAKKFSMNHFKYDFERYAELVDDGFKSKNAFNQMIQELQSESEDWYEINYADGLEMKKAFESEYALQQKKRVSSEDIRHLFFQSVETPSIQVTFQSQPIESRYGNTTVRETLGIDSRLLIAKNFKKLDCPPICIPSIKREGKSDFHCVYFEGPNAMGQLNKWATIVIVRENQREEYARRYASPHTFIVSLSMRKKRTILTDAANVYGYSAGDSKYYCWRIANWLHTLWKTPAGKRRCVIMDDQVAPFGHQVPIYSRNRAFKPKSTKFSYYNTASGNQNNDQYKFRTTIFDRQGRNMMYSGNSRWYLTHAATFMYMNQVCDIMDAGIVCMTSTVSQQDFPLSNNPKSNCVWFVDLYKMNAALHTRNQHHIETSIHPAYQAGEDLFMHMIHKNRNIRSVNLNTIRWRSETTGGGTCGRGGIKPFQPIVKYHELSTVLHFNPGDVTMRKVSKMPKLTKGTKPVRELLKTWGADRVVYKTVGGCKEQLSEIWVEKNGVIFHANIDDAEEPCWFGDEDIKDSKLSVKNAYAPRHIFTAVAVQLLAMCIGVSGRVKRKTPATVRQTPQRQQGESKGEDSDKNDYSDMRVAELKAEMNKRGLTTVGKKATMIARLEEDDADDDWLYDVVEDEEEEEVWHAPKVGDRIRIKYKGPGEFYNGDIVEKSKKQIVVEFDDGDEETFKLSTFSKKYWNKTWWYI